MNLDSQGQRLASFGKRMRQKPVVPLMLATLFYYFLFFNYGLDLDDEGFLLAGASSVLNGHFPMADFFSYQPFSYFLLAGFFKLIGEGVLAERIMLLCLLLLNVLLLTYISRRVIPSQWYLLPVVIYAFAPGPWYKVFYIFHLISVSAALVWYLERPGMKRIITVGLVIGIAFISRYEAGLVSLSLSIGTMSVLTPLIRLDSCKSRLRLAVTQLAHLLAASGAILLVIGLCWLTYVLAGKGDSLLMAIGDYYWDTSALSVVENMGIVSRFSLNGMFVEPRLEHWFFGMALFSAIFLLARDSIRFLSLRQNDEPTAIRLLLGAAVLGSLLYSYLFVWNSRMLSTFPLVYILWGYLLWELHVTTDARGYNRVSTRLPFGVTVFAMLVILSFCKVQNYSGSISTRAPETHLVDHPLLRGIHVYHTQVEDIKNMMALISIDPEATMIPTSESTTMGFLSGKSNPTYYRLFTTELGGRGEPDRLIHAIEHYCIDHFVARKSQFISGGGPGSDLHLYAPRVRQHLIDHYRVDRLGKNFVLLSRNSICQN